MMNRFLASAIVLASLSAAAPVADAQLPPLKCSEFMIPISAQAQNKAIPNGGFDVSSLTTTAALQNALAAIEALPTQLVGGTFQISARYCAPLKDVAKRRDTLQILVHGVTFTKDYWSGPRTSDIGPGAGNTSWIYQAALDGYPTLAIDRLCNGKSSRPDGLLTCQLPLQAEVVNTLVQTARAGNLPSPAKKAWKKIQLVGHSYGSLLANVLTQTHPDSVDQLYLTGFSQNLFPGVFSVVGRDLLLPANVVALTRFPSLDVNYLVPTSYPGTLPTFFLGNYDPAVSKYLFQNTGTITSGELATALLGQLPAPDYKGDVFVADGNLDNIFCSTDPVNAVAGNPGDCQKNGYSKGVKAAYYTNARSFGFYNIPGAGHCWVEHNAPVVEEGLAAVFAFADASGY